MKKKMLLWLTLFSVTFSLHAGAVTLPGSVTGYGLLGCVMSNFTGVAQVVDQVQYQYTCNHGPRDPFHMYFQVLPCFGNCEVESGRTIWHTNGPWTYNCLLISSSCMGFAHPAPTPMPTSTPEVSIPEVEAISPR